MRRTTIDSRTAGLGFLLQGNVWIRVEERGSDTLPAQHRIDMRIRKNFRIGAGSLYVWADNPYNWQEVISIMGPDISKSVLDKDSEYLFLHVKHLSLEAECRRFLKRALAVFILDRDFEAF